MSYRPIQKRLYAKDITKDEATGFYMYEGRRICGHIIDTELQEICKSYPMPNGRCKRHGGCKITTTSFTKDAIGEVVDAITPENLDRYNLGVEFKQRYEEYKLNPDHENLSNEIAQVSVLIGLLLERLNESNLPIYAEIIGKMAKTVADIKERYYKIKTGYFDIYSVKLIIVQLIRILTSYMEQIRCLISEEKNLLQADKLKDNVLHEIETIKLPMVKD